MIERPEDELRRLLGEFSTSTNRAAEAAKNIMLCIGRESVVRGRLLDILLENENASKIIAHLNSSSEISSSEHSHNGESLHMFLMAFLGRPIAKDLYGAEDSPIVTIFNGVFDDRRTGERDVAKKNEIGDILKKDEWQIAFSTKLGDLLDELGRPLVGQSLRERSLVELERAHRDVKPVSDVMKATGLSELVHGGIINTANYFLDQIRIRLTTAVAPEAPRVAAAPRVPVAPGLVSEDLVAPAPVAPAPAPALAAPPVATAGASAEPAPAPGVPSASVMIDSGVSEAMQRQLLQSSTTSRAPEAVGELRGSFAARAASAAAGSGIGGRE